MYQKRINFDPPNPPEPEGYPECPECGAETEIFYKGDDGSIIGCDNCITSVDAWQYQADHKEETGPDPDRLYDEWRDHQCS